MKVSISHGTSCSTLVFDPENDSDKEFLTIMSSSIDYDRQCMIYSSGFGYMDPIVKFTLSKKSSND